MVPGNHPLFPSLSQHSSGSTLSSPSVLFSPLPFSPPQSPSVALSPLQSPSAHLILLQLPSVRSRTSQSSSLSVPFQPHCLPVHTPIQWLRLLCFYHPISQWARKQHLELNYAWPNEWRSYMLADDVFGLNFVARTKIFTPKIHVVALQELPR